jgi:hypothetical protein
VFLIIFEPSFLLDGMAAYGISRKQLVLPIPGKKTG